MMLSFDSTTQGFVLITRAPDDVKRVIPASLTKPGCNSSI